MRQTCVLIVTLIASILISAFRISDHENRNRDDRQLWYEFLGTDVNDPTDYFLLGEGTEAPSCSPGPNRCAVLAQPNPGLGSNYPDLNDEEIQVRTME